jgi:hypothetical protein
MRGVSHKQYTVHGSIGSGSDPHAQTWTAIQTARSELDKGAKAQSK